MPGSAVILWWGAEIRILASDGKISRLALGETDDPVSGILRIAGDACVGAQTVRIVYHPDTLDAHEISCPNTSRSRLRKILGREYRALNGPDAVWSAEPIRRGQRGYATVLYIDKGSRLPRLLDGLARGGIRAEGVWPLQSLIEITPPCDAAGGCFLSLVAVGRRALVSCVGPSGDRSARFFEGGEIADAAIAEMGAVLARFEEGATPPGLAVVEESAHAAAFGDAMRARSLAGIALADFLGHARLLPSRGFSDFLRRKPLFARRPAPRRMMAFAGLVLAMGLAGFACESRRQQARARLQAAAWREHQAAVERWAATRAAIGGRIGQLTQAIGRVQGAAQPQYEFLAALARTTPKAIALRSVAIQDGAIAIKGRIYEGAGRPDNPLAGFLRELAGPEEPWRFPDAPPRDADGEFTLTGMFRPALPAVPPEDSAQPKPEASSAGSTPESVAKLETQLAAALARLPAAKDFDSLMQNTLQNWIVETRSAESIPGVETRRYGLVFDHPKLSSWPDIVEVAKILCAVPGLTIDGFSLAAAPDGADAFQQVEISLTVRLRP